MPCRAQTHHCRFVMHWDSLFRWRCVFSSPPKPRSSTSRSLFRWRCVFFPPPKLGSSYSIAVYSNASLIWLDFARLLPQRVLGELFLIAPKNAHSNFSQPNSLSHLLSPTIQWSGIQNALEHAQSDVLVLSGCCYAGIANNSKGSGGLRTHRNLRSTANGVRSSSFTKELELELRELIKLPSFPIGDLYHNIFYRVR